MDKEEMDKDKEEEERESKRLDENLELSNFKLPIELLTKIIEMVPICQWTSLESVSRQFKEAVDGLWGEQGEIRLNELSYNKEKEPYQVVDGELRKFFKRAPNVVSISGFAQFSSIRLSTIQLLSNFQHLQTIDFSGQQRVITAENVAGFLELSESRESWKSLNIVDGIYGTMNSHNAVVDTNQPPLNLECFKFNAKYLSMFDRFLPIEWSGLKKLVIVHSFYYGREVLSIIRQCTQVTHLEVEVPDYHRNGQPSFANFLQAVADLENLSVLKFIGGPVGDNGIHDALLVMIQDLGRRHITDFALMWWRHCSHRMVDAIIENLKHLKSLEIDVINCTQASLERLANRMGKLETLKFRLCCGVVNSTVTRAVVKDMSNLQCLHLVHLNMEVDDFTILGDLRKLKELRVTGSNTGFGTIETWTRLGFGSCLETLELDVDGISAEAMGDFLKNMPRLRSMKLKGATDDILEAIAVSCPNLVELDLRRYFDSPTITSIGFQSLIDRCSELKILNVVEHRQKSSCFPSALKVGKYRTITFKSEWNE